MTFLDAIRAYIVTFNFRLCLGLDIVRIFVKVLLFINIIDTRAPFSRTSRRLAWPG